MFSKVCFIFLLSINTYSANKVKSKKFPTKKVKVRSSIINIPKIKSSMSYIGNYVDNRNVEARTFGLVFKFDTKFEILPSLSTHATAGANLETGSNNSTDIIGEYEPDQSWFLSNGYLKWEPMSVLSFKAGAVNQGEYKSPLLISSSAFLALEEKFVYNFSPEHSFYFKMQQSIPNNKNLQNRIGDVEEGTPAFNAETIGMNLKGDLLSLWIEASKWSFNNLSNSVAHNSQFSGNSTGGNSIINAYYLYQFSGYNFSGEMQSNITDMIGIELIAQYLYNDKAPNNRNTGLLLQAGLKIEQTILYVNSFSNKSDSSPAFYNSKKFGHNNMEGYSIGVKDKCNKKTKFCYEIIYRASSPIDKTNLFQSDTKSVFVSLKHHL